MKTRNFLTAGSLLFAMAAVAAPLTPEQAMQRARGNAPARIAAKIKASAAPVYTARTASGAAAAYVFAEKEGGFVILGGDDIAYPVLGYSDEGKFDAENVAPEMKWWLGEYARRIEWAAAKGAQPAADAPEGNSDWKAINPLVSSKWNQDGPYNNLCPSKSGVRTVTGCVATSMAQVMNYFKYPDVGEGKVRYYCQKLGRDLALNFEQRAFDWDNMLNIYKTGEYSEAQAEAVAYLMKACGYSVNMNYGTDVSGATGFTIAPALVQYFKYDKNTRDHMRDIYSASQWTKMMYENLRDIGPVVVNGQSPLEGGHSFVCDGYDGNGLFHFNWGWGGMSDGFYALDALNPDAQGIGGYAGGFNFSQNAIFGIQPPKGEAVIPDPDRIFQYGTSTATVSGNTITFSVKDFSPLGWGNGTTHDINVSIGIRIEGIDGTSTNEEYVTGMLGSYSTVTLSPGSYYSAERISPSFTLPALQDGTYRVTLCTRAAGDDSAEWYPVLVPWGYKNFVDLKVSGSNRQVIVPTLDYITISDFAPGSALYSGKNVKLTAHISNSTDIELTQGVSPVLTTTSGAVRFEGQSVLVSLMPGEEKDFEWVSKFLTLSGESATVSSPTELILKLKNPQNNQYYDGCEVKVTLEPQPGTTKVRLKNFQIPGVEFEEMTVNDRYYPRVAQIPNMNDFTFDFAVECTSGFYDGQITIGISRQNPENPSQMLPVIDQIFSVQPFLAAGESTVNSIKVSFPEAEDGVLYFIEGSYTLGSRVNSLATSSFIKAGSGVEGIDADDSEAEYYNLQGLRISEPENGQMVIVKKGGKTSKMIYRN